jgi:hypothetical protein
MFSGNPFPDICPSLTFQGTSLGSKLMLGSGSAIGINTGHEASQLLAPGGEGGGGRKFGDGDGEDLTEISPDEGSPFTETVMAQW